MADKFTFHPRWLAGLALLVWVGITWWLFTLPGTALPGAGGHVGDFIVRQGGHLGLHTVLTILAWQTALTLCGDAAGLLLGLAFALANAVLDELYQWWVPGHSVNLEDVAFNVSGVLLGLFLIWKWRWIRTKLSMLFPG